MIQRYVLFSLKENSFLKIINGVFRWDYKKHDSDSNVLIMNNGSLLYEVKVQSLCKVYDVLVVPIIPVGRTIQYDFIHSFFILII